MKFLSAVVFFLACLISAQPSFGQDSAAYQAPDPATLLQDTTIYLEGSFIVRNVYAVKDSIRAFRIWASKMRDTTIALDPAFAVINFYAEKDSIDSYVDPVVAKRRAIRDSLNAIGSALLHMADLQDTIIALETAFVVKELYQRKDREAAIRDSLVGMMEQAATMQDTTIALETAFVIRNYYQQKDRLQAIQDSLNKPMMMQDTLINLDSSFLVRDLYPIKDSLEFLRDSLIALSDSLYADSVNRHWAGWKKYEVRPQNTFDLQSNATLKGKTKTDLQYNVADFYLFLNGEPVMPPNSPGNFFPAAFLGFKFDDTLLLNSGLGAKMGIGVGIKVYDGRFTSSLHANTHNTEIYKLAEDDSVYLSNLYIEPVSQNLIFKYFPDGSKNEILFGEYQAEYRKFFQKNEEGQDEERKYRVRIIFRCRVSGGISSMGSGK